MVVRRDMVKFQQPTPDPAARSSRTRSGPRRIRWEFPPNVRALYTNGVSTLVGYLLGQEAKGGLHHRIVMEKLGHEVTEQLAATNSVAERDSRSKLVTRRYRAV